VPLKKFFIGLFIFLSLALQVKANLGLKYPYFAVSEKTSTSNWYYQLARLDWRLGQLAWLTGLSTKWRMFSPPPMSNWYYSVWALNSNGGQEWVPLYAQGERNFWQRNFLDFRETKFQLNIYNKPEALSKLAAHLCIGLKKAKKDVVSIRVALVSRDTLPPENDDGQVDVYGEERVSEFGVYPCAP